MDPVTLAIVVKLIETFGPLVIRMMASGMSHTDAVNQLGAVAGAHVDGRFGGTDDPETSNAG
jgi:hypothetical protein